MVKKSKAKQGLAAMSSERRREIAALGGKAVSNEKRGFSNRELASKAGSLGGKATPPESRTFSQNRELAASAGRKGGRRLRELTKAKSDTEKPE
jgi:general stress protein YciG